MQTQNNIELALQQYGLTPEQISVYLFLIKNGDQVPFKISKGTRIPRTTIYRILEELRNLGIVSIFKKNNIANYTAENPRRLLERLKEKESAVSSIIPSIENLLQNKGNNPQVKLYVGQNGAKIGLDVLYEYFEKKGLKQMYTYSNSDLSKHLPKYLDTKIDQRKRLGIKLKLIAPNSAKVSDHHHYKTDDFRHVRYLPEKFPFEGSMIMGESMAVCFSLKDDELHTIVLESESIVKMFTQFFLYIWDSLAESN
ncbi:MAG: helix-turn-helix domain-containing protein [bacterium]